MAKTDIWMPLYVSDYLDDTRHLSTLEHGAYLLLLMTYWKMQGPLPDDDVRLSRMVGMSLKQWKNVRPVIAAFFVLEGGKWHSTRSQEEISASQLRSSAARAKALKRYATDDAGALPEQSRGNAAAKPQQCPSSSSSSEVYETVPKGTGDESPVLFDFPTPEKRLFAYGKELLGKTSGGQINRLLKHFGGDPDRAIVCLKTAAEKNSPAEYIGAVLRGTGVETTDDVIAETDRLYEQWNVE